MPELPEVEVTRRSIADIDGARIVGLSLGKPLRWPLGGDPARLEGLRAGPVGRRGKYLLLPLVDPQGRPAGVLLWHLGMSGSLSFRADPGPAGKHDHVDLVTERGTLRLNDPRRFGAVVWSPSLDEPPARDLLAGLGREPFDDRFTAAEFHAALQRRRQAVKPALLAGDIVVGAGNIYACDALFEAGIDPRTPCTRIGPQRAARLLAAIRLVLGEAVARGGSTLRNFSDALGRAGHYQQAAARVYGREGEPCVRCGAPVRRLVQGQRSTYYCTGCQHR
jgi:formamidopyrimidine-DNA glycosylase